MGHFCLQHLWMDGDTAGKVLPKGQSGVPLMVRKEKWEGSHLSSLLWTKCFGTFLLEYPKKQIFFFYFIYCGFLLYMNCFCWTLCSKHSLSAPLDLCDTSSQMQMMGPNITRTGGNSREGESCILGEEIGARKAVFQFFTQRVFSVFSLLFSKNSRFVALRTLQRMSLIFQRSLPTPLSSQKMPSWTFNKIQLDSSIHLPS